MKMDRLQAMATFVRVVDTGSFSAAARQLGVGQPAVSKTVAQLEEWLGVRLLLRSTRRLTPSEAGQRYYERARRALEETEGAEAEARGAGSGLSGRLRISAATTFARLHVIPHLPDFMNRHPQLEMDVILDDRQIDLLREGIDLSLRMGSLADSGALARKLASGRRSVVATPAYLARAGRPQHPSDLAGLEAVLYGQESPGWVFRQSSSEVSIVPRSRLSVSAAEGLRAAVLAHMGIALVSDWMFAPELANGAVVRVLEDWALPGIDLWALYPSGRLASAKARAFADFVASALA
jgi:DNA-binding transcriptional LysR family regulator